MFRSICLNAQDHTGLLDLGFLAETMLFYENVRVIANYGILKQLLIEFGPDLLLEYIKEGFITISYLDTFPSIKTFNSGTNDEIYQPVATRVRQWQLQNAVPYIFQDILGKSGKGRRLGNKFSEHIHPVSCSSEIIRAAREDFKNKEYIKRSVAQILHLFAPDYHLPKYFHFNIISDGDIVDFDTHLTVNTNLDFKASNGLLWLNAASGLKPISPTALLGYLFNARSELHFSSLYEGEIATSKISSTIIKVKCQDLLNSRMRNEANIELFQDQLLDQGHAIREAINSHERNYKDLFKLLQSPSAHKFRHWLHRQEPGIDIVKAYYKEITTSTWIETLPAKILRWTILGTIGVGLAQTSPLTNIVVPNVLSAADSFLLDKLARGWKPDQFVEKSLKPFLT